MFGSRRDYTFTVNSNLTKLHQAISLYESTTAEKSADAKTAVGVGVRGYKLTLPLPPVTRHVDAVNISISKVFFLNRITTTTPQNRS